MVLCNLRLLVAPVFLLSSTAQADIAAPLRELQRTSKQTSTLSQDQLGRLDAWARYTVATPMCLRLGFDVGATAPEQLENTIRRETATWGVYNSALTTAIDAAVKRESTKLQVDLATAANLIRTDHDLRKFHRILLPYGEVCLEAAADPLFSQFIRVPANYNLEESAITADRALENSGFASWQTPAIRARGDLLLLAGACRKQFGAARTDELKRMYGESGIAAERQFYLRSFTEGTTESNLRNLNTTQCERALKTYERKIEAARR